LILVLLGGLVLVLGTVLAYLALWRREDRGDAVPAAGHRPVPLVLILTGLGLGLFGVIYTVVMMLHPQKW
jgi:uncharacterized membrane protein YidH (DUF202 family)